MPMEITLSQLEQAINHWRIVHPSQGEERALSPEVNALANVYALMIFQRRRDVQLDDIAPPARELLQAWLQQKAGA